MVTLETQPIQLPTQYSHHTMRTLSFSEADQDLSSRIPALLRSYTCRRRLNRTSSTADSGTCSIPNSPEVRGLRSSCYKPRTFSRSTISSHYTRQSSSVASSQLSVTSRKTSNGSFCDTLHSLLNIPNEFSENLVSTTINFTRNNVTPEQALDELLIKVSTMKEMLKLPDIANANVKLTQGRLSGHNDMRRVGKVRFEETSSKVAMEADIVGNNIEILYTWSRGNISGSCLIKIRTVMYKIHLEQVKSSYSNVACKGILFGNVSGVTFKVIGLGPLNWVWKCLIIGSVKKGIKMLLSLTMKEELELCLKKESIIEKMYIPILERKFSRK